MPCEDERAQVELLELLTELQREAYSEAHAEEISVSTDAGTACGRPIELLLDLATGETTPDELSEACVGAIGDWVDAINEEIEEYLLLLDFAEALEEAADRYTECLHESAVPF